MSDIEDALAKITKAGDDEKKISAVGALFTLATDDETREEILNGGGLKVLVGCLKTKNKNLLKPTTGALLNCALDANCRDEIIRLGGMDLMVGLMEPSRAMSDEILEYVTGAILNMVNDGSEQAREICKKMKIIPSLHKCMQSENDEIRRNAVGIFTAICMEADLNDEMFKLDKYEAIINCLDSEDPDTLSRATGCVWNLSVNGDETREALANAGALEKLLSLLDTQAGDNEILANTSMCLSIIAAAESNSNKIRELGGLEKVVALLEHPDELVQTNAVAAVWNLSHVEANRDVFHQHDVMKHIVPMLDYESQETLEKVIGACLTLALKDQMSADFRKLGGIDKLPAFLEDKEHEKLLLYTLIFSAVLAYETDNKDALRESGVLAKLVEFLSSDNDQWLEKATGGILNLTLNAQNRVAVRQLDGIAPLIELLYHPNSTVQQNAAGALWNLSLDEINKGIIRKLGGLQPLLTLIGGGSVAPRSKAERTISDDAKHNAMDEVEEPVQEEIDPSAYTPEANLEADMDLDAPNKQLDGNPRTRCALSYPEWGPEDDMEKGTLIIGCDRFNLKKRLAQIAKEKEREEERKKEEAEKKQLAEQEAERLKREARQREREKQEQLEREKREKERIAREESEKKRKEEEETKKREEEKRKREEEQKRLEEEEARLRAEAEATENMLDAYAPNKKLLNDDDLGDIDLSELDPSYDFNESKNKEAAKKNAIDTVKNFRNRLIHDDETNRFLSDNDRNLIQDALDELLDFVEHNPDASAEEIDKKRELLEKLILPVLLKARAKKDLEDEAKAILDRLTNDDRLLSKLSEKEKKGIRDAAEDVLSFLATNPNATMDELSDKRSEFHEIIDPILKHADMLNELEDRIKDVEGVLEPTNKLSGMLNPDEKKKLEKEVQRAKDFLEFNKAAPITDIADRIRSLEDTSQPIIDRAKTRLDLVEYAQKLRDEAKDMNHLKNDEKEIVESAANDVLTFIQDNGLNATTAQLREKKDELVGKTKDLVDRQKTLEELTRAADRLRQKLKDDQQLASNIKPNERKLIDNTVNDTLDFTSKVPKEKIPTREEIKDKKIQMDNLKPLLAKADAKKQLMNEARDLKDKLYKDEALNRLTNSEKQAITKTADDVLKWLETADPTISQIKDKKKELGTKTNPILDNAKSRKELEKYVLEEKKRLDDKKDPLASKLTADEKRAVRDAIEATSKWLDGAGSSCTAPTADNKREECRTKVDGIYERAKDLCALEATAKGIERDLLQNKSDPISQSLSDKEKKTIQDAVQDTLNFVSTKPGASKSDSGNKKEALTNTIKPIKEMAESRAALNKKLDDLNNYLLNDSRLNPFVSPGEKKSVQDSIAETKKWISANPNHTNDDLKSRIVQLNDKVEPINRLAKARKDLDDYANELIDKISENGELQHLNPKEKAVIAQVADDLKKFVQSYPNTLEEIACKKKEAKATCNPIIEKNNMRKLMIQKARDIKNQVNSDPTLASLRPAERKLIEEITKEFLDILANECKDPNDAKKGEKELFRWACRKLRDKINDDESLARMAPEEKKQIENSLDDTISWIDKDKANKITPENIKSKKKELTDKIKPVIELAEERKYLADTADSVLRNLKNPHDPIGKRMTDDEKQLAHEIANDALDFIMKNPVAGKGEVEDKRKEFSRKLDRAINRPRALNNLDDDAHNVLHQYVVDNTPHAHNLTKDDKKKLQEAINQAVDFVNKNPNAALSETKEQAKKFETITKPITAKADARTKLEDNISNTQELLSGALSHFLTKPERDQIAKQADESKKWLTENPNATLSDVQKQQEKFDSVVEPLNKIATCRKELSDSARTARNRIHDKDGDLFHLNDQDKRTIDAMVNDAFEFLRKNPCVPAEIEQKRVDLETRLQPIADSDKARKTLSDAANAVLQQVNDKKDPIGGKLTVDEKKKAEDAANKALNFLKSNPNVSPQDVNAERSELDKIVSEVLARANDLVELDGYMKDIMKDIVNNENSPISKNLSAAEKAAIKQVADKISVTVEKKPTAPISEISALKMEVNEKVNPLLEKSKVKAQLQDFCNKQLDNLKFNDPSVAKLTPAEKKQVEKAANDGLGFLKKSPNASEAEIQRVLDNTQQAVDPLLKLSEARDNLEHLAKDLKENVAVGGKLSDLKQKDKQEITKSADDALNFLKKNPEASAYDVEQKHQEVVSKLQPIIGSDNERNILKDRIADIRENMKSKDNKLAQRLTPEERKQIEVACADAEKFLEKNPLASKKEINDKADDLDTRVANAYHRANQLQGLEDAANNALQQYVHGEAPLAQFLTHNEKDKILNAVENTKAWVEDNPKAPLNDIRTQKEMFDKKIAPIIEKAQLRSDIDDTIRLGKKILEDERLKKRLTPEEKETVSKAIENASNFLDNHPNATEAQLQKEKAKLKDVIKPLADVAQARDDLGNFVSEVSSDLRSGNLSQLSPKDKQIVKDVIKEGQDYLNKYPANADEIHNKIKELDRKLAPLRNKASERQNLKDKARELLKKVSSGDDKLIPKHTADERKAIEATVNETLGWLDSNPEASAADIKAKEDALNKKLETILDRAKQMADLEKTAKDILSEYVAGQNSKSANLSPKDKELLKQAADKALNFVDTKPNATIADIKQQQKELDDKTKPIISKIHSKAVLEDLANHARNRLMKDDKILSNLTDNERKVVERAIDEALDFIEKSPNASEQDIEKARDKLEKTITPVFKAAEARDDFRKAVLDIRDKLQDVNGPLGDLTNAERKILESAVNDALGYLATNPTNADEINKKKEQFIAKVSPVVDSENKRGELEKKAKDELRKLDDKGDALANRLTREERKIVEDSCKDALNWLAANPTAAKDKIEQKQHELEQKINKGYDRPREMGKLEDNANDILSKFVNNKDSGLSDAEKDTLKKAADKALEFVQTRPFAPSSEVKQQQQLLDSATKPVFDKAQARRILDDLIDSTNTKLLSPNSDLAKNLSPEERKNLEKAVEEARKFVKDNPNATKQQIDEQIKKLEKIVTPLTQTAEARNNMRNFIDDNKRKILDPSGEFHHLSPAEKEMINKVLSDAAAYLDKYPTSVEEINKKLKETQDKLSPLLKSAANKKDLMIPKRLLKDTLVDQLLGADDSHRKLIDSQTDDLLGFLDAQTHQDVEEKAKNYEERMKELIETAKARTKLNDRIKDIRNAIKDDSKLASFLTDEEKAKIEEQLNKTAKWMEDHPNATKQQIEEQIKNMDKVIKPILSKAEACKDMDKWASDVKFKLEHDPNLKDNLSASEKATAEDAVKDAIRYLESMPTDAVEVRQKHDDLKDKVDSLVDKATALSKLKKMLDDLQNKSEELSKHMSESEKKKLNDAIKEAKEWLEKNPNASAEQLKEKMAELEEITKPIINKARNLKDIYDKARKLKKDLRDDPILQTLSNSDRGIIESICDELIDWANHPDTASLADIEEKKGLLDKAKKLAENAKARDRFETELAKLKQRIQNPYDRLFNLPQNDRKLVDDAIADSLNWLDTNITGATRDDVDAKQKEFHNKVDPILGRTIQIEELKDRINKLKQDISDRNGLQPFLTDDEKRVVDLACDELLKWLEDNPNATPEQVEKKLKEFNEKTKDILERAKAKKQVHNTMEELRKKMTEDDHIAPQLTDDDKRMLDQAINDAQSFIDNNKDASTADILDINTQLKTKTDPIIDKARAKHEMKDYIYNTRNKLEQDAELKELPQEQKDKILDKTGEALEWLASHPDSQAPEILEKLIELKEAIQPMLTKASAAERLKSYAQSIRNALKNDPDLAKLSLTERNLIDKAVQDALDFLEFNPHASRTELEEKLAALEKKVKPILDKAKAKSQLQDFANNLRKRIKDANDPLSQYTSPQERELIDNEAKEALAWLSENPNATFEQIDEKKMELEDKVNPTIDRANKTADLKNYANNSLKELSSKPISQTDAKRLKNAVDSVNDQLKKNPMITPEELARMRRELKNVTQPIQEKVAARTRLQDHVNKFRNRMMQSPALLKLLNPFDKKKVEDTLNKAQEVAEKKVDASVDDLNNERKKLNKEVAPVLDRVDARNSFQEQISSIRTRLNDKDDVLNQITPPERKTIESACDKGDSFLKAKPNATKAEIDDAKREFNKNVDPVLNRYGARADLRNYVENMRKKMASDPQLAQSLNKDARNLIESSLKETLDWLNTHLNAAPEEVRNKKVDLQNKVEPIIGAVQKTAQLKDYVLGIKKQMQTDKHMVSFLTNDEKNLIKKKLGEADDLIKDMQTKAVPEAKVDAIAKDTKETIDPIIDRAIARKELQQYAEDVLTVLNESKILKDTMAANDRQLVNDLARETLDWIKNNPNASAAQLRFRKMQLEDSLRKAKTFRFDVPDVRLTYYNTRVNEKLRWGDMDKRTKDFHYGSYLKGEKAVENKVIQGKARPEAVAQTKPNFVIQKSAPKKAPAPIKKEDVELLKLFEKMRAKTQTVSVDPSKLTQGLKM